MSKKSVEKLFKALYRLTDMRKILRKTSPNHELNDKQKKKFKKHIEKVRKNLKEIEKEMLE